MPTAITHAVVGAALAPLAPRPLRRVRLALALAAVAALPDLDVVAFRFGIPYAHALGHRGLSHSLPFAALLAVVLTRVLYGSALGVGSRRWWALVGLFFIAAASHGLLDACTDGGLGVGLFLPLSEARIFFPWRPLAVSPLSVRAFLGQRGWAILSNEIAWVWLPAAAALGLVLALRRWKGER